MNFLVISVVLSLINHFLLKLSSKFIQSKPPGSRMVTTDINVFLNKTLNTLLYVNNEFEMDVWVQRQGLFEALVKSYIAKDRKILEDSLLVCCRHVAPSDWMVSVNYSLVHLHTTHFIFWLHLYCSEVLLRCITSSVRGCCPLSRRTGHPPPSVPQSLAPLDLRCHWEHHSFIPDLIHNLQADWVQKAWSNK